MNLSVDLIFLVVNILLLAFSYGKFSEKIKSLEDRFSTLEIRIETLTAAIEKMSNNYYSMRDGIKLEASVAKIWEKMDTCTGCHNGTEK